jgi:hypothetical protein
LKSNLDNGSNVESSLETYAFCIALVPIFCAHLEKQTAAAGGSAQCVRLLLIMRVFIAVIMVQESTFPRIHAGQLTHFVPRTAAKLNNSMV